MKHILDDYRKLISGLNIIMLPQDFLLAQGGGPLPGNSV